MDKVKTARAKTRQRERAVWDRVEAIGRDARRADVNTVSAKPSLRDEPQSHRFKASAADS